MSESDMPKYEQNDTFKSAWEKYTKRGPASGWEKIAFTLGFGAGFEAGRLSGLEERAKEFAKAVSNHHYWKERAQTAERALDKKSEKIAEKGE